jgi:hypothetical protein
MPAKLIRNVNQALRNLNPDAVRVLAEQPVRIGLVAATPESLGRMESYLCPPHFSAQRRARTARMLSRNGAPGDIDLYDENLLRPANAFGFVSEEPSRTVEAVLDTHPDLWIPLARNFEPFRKPVSYRLIQKISRENALFSLMSALPNIVPSVISVPWAVGEFASDTAFLTMNQVRMVFLLAAANDRPVGYREQKAEIATILMGAFGWRAVARELAGKVPMGAGLVSKAAISWAGTFVAGLSFERLYRLGYAFTREERRGAYEQAYKHGREIADLLLSGLRRTG